MKGDKVKRGKVKKVNKGGVSTATVFNYFKNGEDPVCTVIKILFSHRFDEIESKDERVVKITINPILESFFQRDGIFHNEFDPESRKVIKSLGLIGELWGASVVVVKNLEPIAIFMGENGTTVEL